MERMFERAYARAEGRLSQAEAAAYGGAGAGTSGGHGGADAGPSSCGGGKGGAAAETPLAELKPVQRILKCWETKDYFSLIGLPEPEADELGRPVWTTSDADISRAYRKLSVVVHPDKNPGDDDARKAFEALNKTHRLLKDPNSREDVLRDCADRARRRRERQEGAADLSTRMALNASKNARARELRKGEGQGLQGTILEQMKKRQAEAQRRMEAAKRVRRPGGDDDGADEDDGDGDEGYGRGVAPGRGGRGDAPAAPVRGGRGDSDEEGGGDVAALAAAKKRKKHTFI